MFEPIPVLLISCKWFIPYTFLDLLSIPLINVAYDLLPLPCVNWTYIHVIDDQSDILRSAHECIVPKKSRKVLLICYESNLNKLSHKLSQCPQHVNDFHDVHRPN